MSYIHPPAAEHLRRRWTRHAWRFAPPGSAEATIPGDWPVRTALRSVAEEQEAEAKAHAAAEQEAFERELLELRRDFAALKLDYELRRFQQKYSPDQPRVPAGNSDGGQWTSGGGGSEGDASSEALRTEPAQLVIRICIVGSKSITTDQWGNQKYWAEYTCADGHSFIRYGVGGKVPGFYPDPRL